MDGGGKAQTSINSETILITKLNSQAPKVAG